MTSPAALTVPRRPFTAAEIAFAGAALHRERRSRHSSKRPYYMRLPEVDPDEAYAEWERGAAAKVQSARFNLSIPVDESVARPTASPGEYIIDGQTFVTCLRAAKLRSVSHIWAYTLAQRERWQTRRTNLRRRDTQVFLKDDVLAGIKSQRKPAM